MRLEAWAASILRDASLRDAPQSLTQNALSKIDEFGSASGGIRFSPAAKSPNGGHSMALM